MKKSPKYKLLLIDDDKHSSHSMRDSFELRYPEEFEIVGIGATEDEAVQLTRRCKPTFILMDLSLRNGGSGLEAIRRIREIDQKVLILILTGHQDDQVFIQALKAGANGYQFKGTTTVEETRANLLKALESGSVMTEDQNRKIMQIARNPEGVLELTQREKQVLLLYAMGLERKAVSQRLNLSPHRVRNITQTILNKLDAPRIQSAIVKARAKFLIPDPLTLTLDSNFFDDIMGE